MRQEDIIKFFKHVASRESSHGVTDAFRFKKILTSRKNGMLDSPKYKDPDRDPTLSIAPAAIPAQTYTSIFRFHNEVSDPTAVIEQNTETMTESITKQNDPTAPAVPSPAVPPRIRPRPKYKNIMDKTSTQSYGIVPDALSAMVPNSLTSTSGIVPNSDQPLLTLDPEYQRDPEIHLDPSLEPDFGRHSSTDRNDVVLSPWMDASIPATTMTIPPVPDIQYGTVPDTALQIWINSTSPASTIPQVPDIQIATVPDAALPISTIPPVPDIPCGTAPDIALQIWTNSTSTTSTQVPDVQIATVPDTALPNSTHTISPACIDRTPASKRPVTEPARMSQRLKGKSDLLAIEEAKKLLAKGKKRRL